MRETSATKSVRILAVAVVLAGAAVTLAPASRADTIIYNDLTETPTLTHTGTDTSVEILSGCSGPESISPDLTTCRIALSRGVQNIVSGGGALFLAEDPQLQFFSDSLVVSADTQVVEFTSLPDETAVLCSSMGVPCTIQETGQLQGLTITWSGGASADGIFIESDVEPSAVPEPTSGFLLVTGLIGLLGVRLARASGLAALH